MSATTGIQWTDATWNPVVGCTQVSPGCAHCYAKALHDQRHKASLAGKMAAPQYRVPFEVVQLKPDRLRVPLSWREPRRIFVNSVSDLFHDDVPDEYIDRVFAVMAMTPWHTYQILTKRPARMLAYMTETFHVDRDRGGRVGVAIEALVYGSDGLARFRGDRWWTPAGGCIGKAQPWPLPNVWLGVSVENQRFADERIPLLLQTPAAVRFLSCEPLLGPVNLTDIPGPFNTRFNALDDSTLRSAIDWVIVGGESGKGARRFELNWGERIIDDCKAAGVPVFIKQIGAHATLCGPDFPYSIGGHGDDIDTWPNQFRVREFPAVQP
jgi:protein gp37